MNMIEQYLQVAIEFFKEIWFQLNSRFDLENTEAFKFLKPYLIQLQDNPLYIGISLTALFLVPYALIKIRSVSREREQKLDELMEEMEEEYDEDDPRRLRQPESEPDDEDEDAAKPLFGDDEDTSPGYTKVLDDIEGKDIEDEDFEAELEEFELESSEPSSDKEEIGDPQESMEPVSSLLTEDEFDKDLNEFMTEEPDWEEEEKDVASELSLDDSSHDEAIKELQEEGELTKLDEGMSDDDPFSNYSELDEDEQDKAIKDLQEEMERTINQLTQQIDEPDEIPNSIKDLSEIHIGGDATIDEGFSSEEEEEEESFLETPLEKLPDVGSPDRQIEEAPPLSEEPSDTSISDLSDSEILASLEPELEEDGPESVTAPEGMPEGIYYETEPNISSEAFTFEPESDISTHELDDEPEVISENFTFETESDEPEVLSEGFTFETESVELEDIPEPELGTERPPVPMEPETKYSSPEKTDSLIDRLKFLQTRFENRYQPTEPMGAPLEKKISDYVPESLAEPRRYTSTPAGVSPDSKKYMDLLESFIFMKDQRKHK